MKVNGHGPMRREQEVSLTVDTGETVTLKLRALSAAEIAFVDEVFPDPDVPYKAKVSKSGKRTPVLDYTNPEYRKAADEAANKQGRFACYLALAHNDIIQFDAGPPPAKLVKGNGEKVREWAERILDEMQEFLGTQEMMSLLQAFTALHNVDPEAILRGGRFRETGSEDVVVVGASSGGGVSVDVVGDDEPADT